MVREVNEGLGVVGKMIMGEEENRQISSKGVTRDKNIMGELERLKRPKMA